MHLRNTIVGAITGLRGRLWSHNGYGYCVVLLLCCDDIVIYVLRLRGHILEHSAWATEAKQG